MRSLNLKPVMEWFGYSRRERRASFIVVILIITVAGVRLLHTGSSMQIEVMPVEINESGPQSGTNNVMFVPAAGKVKKTYKATKPLINLNTADSAQFESLPAIGPVLAVRIIKFRNLLGGYAFIEQLQEVYGLPKETYELISDKVYADSAAINKIKLNSAAYKQLLRFPYFEKNEVEAIMKYRTERGRISGMTDIVNNQLISTDKLRKVGPYLEFD
jgi:DNA uptake protein ComE-like DNA-binding protein